MKIKLSPQVNSEKIEYIFKNNIITATLNSKTDTFDFTNMPDGICENIETELEINPIISVKKEEGVLFVELLNFIDENETRQEVLFPDWEVI